MRIYSTEDQERVRSLALVREWMGSGLIDPAQLAAVDPDLRTDLRRTNKVLRLVLFVFATIVLQSILGLALLIIDSNNEWLVGTAAIVAAAGATLAAEFLINRLRFFRFGVEEAGAVSAVALVTGGIVLLMSDWRQLPATALLVVASAACLASYARYGYRYMALGAMAGAAIVAFTLELSAPIARSLSAAVLLLIFLAVRTLRHASEEEYLQDEFRLIESAAWLGLYLVVNLQLSFDLSQSSYPRPFFLATYGAIWILPVAGLVMGTRGRERLMIWANLVAALLTLATNKSYLGWERHTWDPILLGVLLTGTAVGLRRWLSAGPSGERAGFTPRRILSSEKASLSMVSTVAGAVQPGPGHQGAAPAPDKFEPGGGSSGGGGASGRY
jgi:hypothetical protein